MKQNWAENESFRQGLYITIIEQGTLSKIIMFILRFDEKLTKPWNTS